MRKTKLSITFLVLGLFIITQNVLASWITQRLTWNSGESRDAAIAVDSLETIHIVWNDDSSGNKEIFYKKGLSGGSSWTTKRLTWNSGDSSYSSIAVDSNYHIFVIWQDNSSGNEEIYFKKSVDGGATWSTKRLTWNSGRSISPDISLDSSGNIHVVWYDDSPGNLEIYYKKSTNDGTSWYTKRLTYNDNFTEAPSVATDSCNAIHIVWMDYKPSNWNIFYQKSSDGGISWSTNRMSWSSGASVASKITISSSDTIYVVWNEYFSGNWEIYLKKSS